MTGAEVAETIVAPYNDLVAVEQAFDEFGDDIACVITEAAAGNMGAVAPWPGFNAGLREITRRYGALLISDEVMTGFRVSAAGWYGLDPVPADITTFGKVMGGGLPAAAFGGPREIMGRLAPSGPVYQAGTLSGNPVAVAAGLTTLRHCTPEVYAKLDAAAQVVGGLAGEALRRRGRRARRAVRRQHVLGVLRHHAGARLRGGAGGAGSEPAPVQGVLPRHARPGRVPAPERVRVVVPHRGPRRRRHRPHRRRPAGRGEGRGRGGGRA